MCKSPLISQSIKQKIDDAKLITLVTHIRPDGDAVGSVIGFAETLRGNGKEVHIAFEETLPVRFRFLKEKEEKKQSAQKGIILTVDCADQGRLPKAFAEQHIDINIDHHATNTNFGELNYVNPKAAATAEIITDLLMEWEMPISPPRQRFADGNHHRHHRFSHSEHDPAHPEHRRSPDRKRRIPYRHVSALLIRHDLGSKFVVGICIK